MRYKFPLFFEKDRKLLGVRTQQKKIMLDDGKRRDTTKASPPNLCSMQYKSEITSNLEIR